MKLSSIAFVAAGLCAAPAFAADAPKADAAAAPAKPAKMEAPKPAPEMVAMTKSVVGTWKCTGKMNMPPDMGGGSVDTKGSMTFKSELNGFALVGEHKGDKSKAMPEMHGLINIGYDAGKKEFEQLYQDNAGGMGHASSKGMDGDKLVWEGEGEMMGKSMKTRMTITKKGDKEQSITHEADMGDGKFVTMMEENCKK
jgi:hypothetical protein